MHADGYITLAAAVWTPSDRIINHVSRQDLPYTCPHGIQLIHARICHPIKNTYYYC
jgi:hypothetical protein